MNNSEGIKNSEIENVISAYTLFFKDEVAELSILQNELRNPASVTSRENVFGHVTTSGLIIRNNEALLIFHNKLKKYIQPGGHIENDATLWQSAQREVNEETGVSVVLHPWHAAHDFIPLNIDIHRIPFNEKKQEIEHYHYDFTYIFTASDTLVTLQEEEVSDFKWVDVHSNADENLLNHAFKKIVNLHISA